MEDSQSGKVVFHLIYHVLIFFIEALVLILLIFGISTICRQSYRCCYEVFGSVSVEKGKGTMVRFEVEPSDSLEDVSKRLAEQNLIVNRYSFCIHAKLMNERENKLHAGTYILSPGMDYDEIMNTLTTSE